ncbi:MAG: sugar phosphate isomerase/epimerase family protein [Candidatus Acidiferrales bacterium]
MERVFSTYRYVGQALSPSLLAEIARAGIQSVEIFCSRSHFDYTSPQAIVELAGWIDERRLALHSLHSPTERDRVAGRQSGIPISICDLERGRRLDAVDEVKRAIDVAERVPFRYLIQHLGHGRDDAGPHRIDAAFNSLEHLVIFAKQRGVTIALENTPSEMGAPGALQHFVAETHLHDLRFCFDVGHAHLETGVAAGFEAMRDKAVTTHIHDNHGEKDEHLLPFDGTVDWDVALGLLAAAPRPLPMVLELKEQTSALPNFEQVRSAFDRIEQELDAKRARATQS